MDLPSLNDDFQHAVVEKVEIGPRREVTLWIAPLVWDGPNGRYDEAVSVRFGAVENFEEVSTFLGDLPYERSELGYLRYNRERCSKPGSLIVEIVFERVDASLEIRCGNIQMHSRSEDGK